MKLTISILGFGSIGKQICSSLLMMKEHEFVINIVEVSDQTKGAYLDFQHATQLFKRHSLTFNKEENLNKSDFIFHCAGASIPKGASRLVGTKASIHITESIFRNFSPQKTTKIIVISNPVDIISFITQKLTGLPAESVVGTGTFLDTIRMDHYLSEQFPQLKNIETVLLGEHGSSVFLSKQLSTIDNESIDKRLIDNAIELALKEVKTAAHRIKETQASTIYGVSFCAIRIFESFLSDKVQKLPVSTLVPDWISKEINCPPIYLSLYSDLNKNGAVASNTHIPDEMELSKFKLSANQLLEHIPAYYLEE